MPLTVGKFGTALYVWTPGFRPGYSKVWRLQVNMVASATESGVVDFLGERLIPASTTNANFFAAYNSPSEVLRYGDEESPPVYMAARGGALGYMGGNHRVGSYDTVSAYSLNIRLDGATITADGWYSGNVLDLNENYGINPGTAADFPILAWVNNKWQFTSSDFCRFNHRLTASRQIDLGWWGGVQIQTLNVAAGRALNLYVPGSITYGGNYGFGADITSLASAISVDVNDWANPSAPPTGFEMIVLASGAPQFTFAMAYDGGTARGDMATALTRSVSAKTYPHGIDYATPRQMSAGESVGLSGYFGTYNGH